MNLVTIFNEARRDGLTPTHMLVLADTGQVCTVGFSLEDIVRAQDIRLRDGFLTLVVAVVPQ